MENTDEVFLKDDHSQWFLATHQSWVGPVSTADLVDRMKTGEISAAHFIWKQGQKTWQRICDIDLFASRVPSLPQASLIDEIQKEQASRKDMESSQEPKHWFLYYNKSQLGPFSLAEIMQALSVGKINGKVHAWREGMQDWVRLQDIGDFNGANHSPLPIFSQGSKESAKSPGKEMRESIRKPLVAKIIMANKNQVTAGICRDISVGGMQVLTDQLPGAVGTYLKLNINPVGSKDLKPFVADGEVVRILEDGRGFSFRFHQLSDDSRSTLEKYLKTPVSD